MWAGPREQVFEVLERTGLLRAAGGLFGSFQALRMKAQITGSPHTAAVWMRSPNKTIWHDARFTSEDARAQVLAAFLRWGKHLVSF